jgi:6-phosphofructokinase 2
MDIVTVTMNPAIDISASVPRIMPIHKLRCSAERRDPGGGGINVARVAARFGADVGALYPVGGPTGELLRRLVDRERIFSLAIPVSGETREDLTIFDEAGRAQYRLVLPGPTLCEAEWQACLDILASLGRKPAFVVASGSLPPGVPSDFYARLARCAKTMGARLLLDTSGEALRAALDEGVHLVKPSLRELSELAGASGLEDGASRIAACRGLVAEGKAELVALTMGSEGALLVARDEAWQAKPLAIDAVNAVGAGDSFLGGMVWSLAGGHGLDDSLRYAVAAASATLLAQGTALGSLADMQRLHPLVAVSRFALPRQFAPSAQKRQDA